MLVRLNTILLAACALLSLLQSCQPSIADKKAAPKTGKGWDELPDVTNLKDLNHTAFAMALESPVEQNKNMIYASAFLLAWDKTEQALKSPVVINDSSSLAFRLVTNSTTHRNVLKETEYEASADIIDGAIFTKAFFRKSLPFATKLQVVDSALNFGGAKVQAFGMKGYDIDITRISQLLYYKDDEHFILKLEPEEKEHEIILAKGLPKFKTLREAVKLVDQWINKGRKEKEKETIAWKYELLPEDMFAIPTIRFHIEHNYTELEGETFRTKDGKPHVIELAYQRNGFILNENGAVVESEVATGVDSAGAEPVVVRPKKLMFDKPFVVLVKRTDSRNPYFVMKVANTELLQPKQKD